MAQRIVRNALKFSLLAGLWGATSAQAQQLATLKRDDCTLLTRRKFTRSWSPFDSTLQAGTPVTILGRSQLNGSTAVIFDLKGPQSVAYKMFEFKASASCIQDRASNAQDDLEDVEQPNSERGRPSAPYSPRVAAGSPTHSYLGELGYYQEELQFKTATNGRLDTAKAKNFGMCAGLKSEIHRNRYIFGSGLCLEIYRASTSVSTALGIRYKSSSFAVGLKISPFALYKVSNRFGLGFGVATTIHKYFFKSSAQGSIAKTLTVLPTFGVKGQYEFQKFSLGTDLGFTNRVSSPYFNMGMGWHF